VVAKVGSSAKIAGFRPGKVPAAIVEKRFAAEIDRLWEVELREAARDRLLQSQKLDVFAIEKIQRTGDEVNAGSPVKMGITLDVRPPIQLPDYHTLDLPAIDGTVADGEVRLVEEAIIRGKNIHRPIHDRPAGRGDAVRLAYEGKLEDGTPLADSFPHLRSWGHQSGTWEVAGEENSHGITAIIQGVIGMAVGEKKVIPMAFSPDFRVKDLAGKTVSYDCELLEIQERIPPARDESLWKELGVAGEKELQEHIRRHLERQKLEEGKLKQREAIANFLRDRTDFPTPKSAYEAEVDRVLLAIVQSQAGRGISEEELEKNRPALVAQAEKMAEQKVRMALIVEAVAKREKIAVDDQELQSLIYQEAVANRCPLPDVIRELKKDRRRVQDLHQRALAIKTFDFLRQELALRKACKGPSADQSWDGGDAGEKIGKEKIVGEN
jgi:trigger factor